MRIATVVSSYEQSKSCFKDHDDGVLCDPSVHAPHDCGYTWEMVPIIKATAVAQVGELVRSKRYDVVINLCDGAFDEDRAGVEVVQALETYNMPYTGANEAFYNLTKEHMKMVAVSCGVRTPAHVFISDDFGISEALVNLDFPMIVKHFNGYGSVGMSSSSRVETEAQLREQVDAMLSAYGAALVEEFIEGREFTVLIAENPRDPNNPVVFDPVECRFPPGESFKHFHMKWAKTDDIEWVQAPELELNSRLRDMARTMFLGLNGVGYGRIDCRVDANDDVYFLEINPNCGIFYPPRDYGSADHILAKDIFGHWGFIKLILECALQAHQRRQKKYKIRYSKSHGYGLQALEDLEPGDIIQDCEEKPHTLVSKLFVKKNWDEPKKSWFHSNAYPVSDGLFVIWSNDPKEWRPIDHSCNPNSWLDGLNLVARRSICRGEAITMDYATFCGDNMKAFACNCGSRNCRGEIKPTDCLESFIDVYGDHVSDYVLRKRKAWPDIANVCLCDPKY